MIGSLRERLLIAGLALSVGEARKGLFQDRIREREHAFLFAVPQRILNDQFKRRKRKSRRAPGNALDCRLGDCLKGILSEFAFEKKLSSGRIRKADVHALVKSAQECLVELGVRTARIEVGRRNDKHGGLAVVLKAIQFREQRIGQIVRMLGGGILSHAVAGDRVDLVNEQDGGCVPPCRGKGFAQLLRAFSHPSA